MSPDTVLLHPLTFPTKGKQDSIVTRLWYYGKEFYGDLTVTAAVPGLRALSDTERIASLETRADRRDKDVDMLTNLIERMVRVEERQIADRKVIWGAVGIVVLIETGGIIFLLERALS